MVSLLHFTSERSTSADAVQQASALLDALDSLLGHSLSRAIVTPSPSAPPLTSTRSAGKASVSRGGGGGGGGAAAASGSDLTLTEKQKGEAPATATATGEAGSKWRLPRAVELTMRAESRPHALDPVIY